MQTCAICNAQSPDTVDHCQACQADLSEHSTRSVALGRYQENPRVLYVRVVVAHDACPACQQTEGAYEKGQVPHLPVAACSHALGCRCNYLPFLEDIYP